MKFLRSLRCALWMKMAIILLSAACSRPGINRFNAPEQRQVASNLVLHRTSRSVVTLTDSEGVGVVYGNIKRIGFKSDGKGYLIVAFEPFSFDEDDRRATGIEVAKVELSTGNVTILSDPDGSIAKSLESIEAFF